MSVDRIIIKRDGFPVKGEIVIGTVTRVLDFGAFVSLDEYENKEGLVHIREVASGWIKDIRDYVKKDQKVVCKVLEVDTRRGHIDLSMKDVTERQKKEKIQQWKNELKAFKWLEIIADKLRISKERIIKVGKKIMKEYDSVYAAFEETAFEGRKHLVPLVGEKIAKAIEELAKENIKPPKVKISGFFELTCLASDGVERIKKTLAEAYKIRASNVELKLEYVGAPKYRVTLEAENYKTAERVLKNIINRVTKMAKKLGCDCKFVRESK